MLDRILEFLYKKEGYVSGEDISHQIGITRQALWKHIHELKELGYDIAALPHQGYRVVASPDRLFPFEIQLRLDTKVLGRKILYFETLVSTMEIAFQHAAAHAPEGTLVVAETQTKGKGRLGRNWFSPKYKGIYLSLVLRPEIAPREASILTLLAAVSICEAVRNTTGIDAQIKWPNDIIIHNKKAGGILTEISAEMDKVFFIIIGMGLNVNNDKRSLYPGSTSLREHRKEEISRLAVACEILRRIEDNYLFFKRNGSQRILESWRDLNITLGRRVRVVSHKEQVEGEAVDIDSDGGLLVRGDSGLLEKFLAGDIVHCR
ncbi:MAG: biotin--[acetyl-CoA-carboxylase] ligase [Candidatus Omnitrophota bacterium]|jgi:BirA family biotin operon repressor/biotin-[acetyl-CoA-carboxylase] ligase